MGIHGGYDGLIQVEDDFYCPFTPKPILEASVGPLGRRRHRRRNLAAAQSPSPQVLRLGQGTPTPGRQPAGRLPGHRPQPEGHVLELPVISTGATDRLCPTSTPQEDVLPCCGKTTVIPGEVAVRFSQPHKWGTEEHAEKFQSGRSTNEAVNGLLKRDSEFGLADPGRRKLR